ncbi:MAG TPA: hypothetical protein VJ720_11530 [Chitinophaga sp.]|nr:hypothetical protein [Chitinophaga sp.]
MKKLFWIVPLNCFFILAGCSKNNDEARITGSETAVLARQCTSCNMSGTDNQAMFIYSVEAKDSLLIANLPLTYKVGDKISFDIRQPGPGEGPLMCQDYPVLPRKIYITNISKVD